MSDERERALIEKWGAHLLRAEREALETLEDNLIRPGVTDKQIIKSAGELVSLMRKTPRPKAIPAKSLWYEE